MGSARESPPVRPVRVGALGKKHSRFKNAGRDSRSSDVPGGKDCCLILTRLIAFPESRRILFLHLLGTGLISLQHGVLAMVPVLIRKHFGGGEWSTTLAASALIMMNLLSIFWNEVYRRMSPGRYILMLWCLAYVPLGFIAACHSPWAVLACVFISATGTAGINPLTGDILRSCYPPMARSKVLACLQSITQLTVMVSAYAVGVWLDIDAAAFRVYFPVSVIVMGMGMWLLGRIGCQPLFVERSRHHPVEPLAVSMATAYRNMIRVLARDTTFLRFEMSYCAFNFAWLICVGLLPLLLTDVLHLDYRQVASCSQAPLQLVLLLGTVPAGYVMDRLGPIRMSVWAFVLISLYPVGLILSHNAWHVAGAIVILGIAQTATNLGWTIGPVTLAANAAHASHYLAIHWTLTTLVGLLGQIPAVAYYRWTGDIYRPLTVAASVFLGASLLIYRLERQRRLTGRIITLPAAATVPAAAPSTPRAA
jgi:MFS family permease